MDNGPILESFYGISLGSSMQVLDFLGLAMNFKLLLGPG
jgi:hypothetical protein